MARYQPAFLAVYALFLTTYFFAETSGKMRYRAPNKILLASLFLAWAVLAFIRRPGPWSHELLLLAGIALAWCGDILLLWSYRKGGILFFCANLCFLGYELLLAGDLGMGPGEIWWAFLLAAAAWAVLFVAARRHRAELGPLRRAALVYGASVALQGSLGLALALGARRTSAPPGRLILLGGGLFLFLVSDCLLALGKAAFPRSKTLLRLNSATYFVGLLGVAMSLSY